MNTTRLILGLIAGFFILRKPDTDAVAVDPGTTTGTTQPPAIDFRRITRPLPFFDIRNDDLGGGDFLDSRNGGTRSHEGVDVVCTPGQLLTSPINGTVVRKIQVYEDSTFYVGVEIQGTGLDSNKNVEIFYVEPFAIGIPVNRGDQVGLCQDISQRRPEWVGVMIPHIHLELKLNGVKVDPSKHVQ